MGACASKFTVLKSAAEAPPPAVKNEVEAGEVNPVEEAPVKRDDAALVEDEASCRQSLGHLLSEREEKGSAGADDAPAQDKTEKIADADGIKSKGLEEAILPCQNVGMEEEAVKLESEGEVGTLKTEKPEEEKAVEIPETLEAKAQAEKVEEKPAEVTECGSSEKAPEAPATEKTDVEKPTSDAEKKEADEKLTDSSVIVISEKNETEEKPAENTKVVIPDEAEDKHVLEPQTTENCAGDKESANPKAEEKATS